MSSEYVTLIDRAIKCLNRIYNMKCGNLIEEFSSYKTKSNLTRQFLKK